MAEKDFFEIGEKRRKLRHEVLDATGVSAREIKARGAVGDEAFRTAVEDGRLPEVAGKVVLSETEAANIPDRLDALSKLDEEAEEFKLFPDNQSDDVRSDDSVSAKPAYEDRTDISDARKQYAKKREMASADSPERSGIEQDSSAQEFDVDPKRTQIFAELDAAKRFSELSKRARYRLLGRPEDTHLAERLRRGAKLNTSVEARVRTLESDPDTRFLVREYRLAEIRRQLAEDGFAVTPSRRAYIDRIETLIESRKPILLEGHTGTGKTELAKYATRELTGKDAYIVYCNPQTRQSDLFGKQSLRESERGATVTDIDFGPLTKALTEGTGVIFDEFNELDPRFRQVLKALYNAKPGDMVNVPGNGKVRVAEGFFTVMTANLKSEKYKEKGALEPQEARVFLDSTIRTDYPPKDELYDIALAALSDPEGGVMLTKKEAEETLRQFVDAVADIEEAYAETLPGHYGRDEDFAAFGTGSMRGKRPQLENYVLDTGMMTRLLAGFRTARMEHGVSLRDFLDESLLRTFEGNAIDEPDKRLAIFMLAQKGFLLGRTQEEFRKRIRINYSNGVLDPTRIAKPEAAPLSEIESLATLSASDIAKIDPYERMRIDLEQEFGLPKGEKPPSGTERPSFTEAREIFQDRFYGPEEIERVFGFRPEHVPDIPFSREDMKRHEKLGHVLVYNPDRLLDGSPLTIEVMTTAALAGGKNVLERDASGKPTKYLLYKEQFGENGEILNSVWFSNDATVSDAAPRAGWQFVSPETMPETAEKTAVEQVDILINVALRDFFGGPPSQAFESAVAEWEAKKSEVENDAEKFASMQIVSFLFEPVQNTVFRYLLMHGTSGNRPFTDGYCSRSATPSSAGSLCDFGHADSQGANVDWNGPDSRYGFLRAVVSRMGY
jgi:MoxR-like ATPase